MKSFAFILIFLFLASTPALAQVPTPQEQPAIDAATAWLARCDAGQYAASWKEASTFFRQAITEQNWSQALAGVRAPLGALQSRTVKTAQSLTQLPGAPDGHYVVLTCDTAFANKKSATETVTFVRDTDGTWRAAGYFIQ